MDVNEIEQVEVEPYPIDYDALEMGDSIPVETVEKIVGVPFSSKDYSLKALSLKDKIRGELWQRGNRWTLANVQGAIVILNDENGSRYNLRWRRLRRQEGIRTFVALQHNDPANMSEEYRKEHEQAIINESKYLMAERQAKKEIKGLAYKRNTPGLPAE